MLITGLPLTGMESTLRKVEIAELAAFSAVLVLAGIIGTGFVRLSLRPLRRVAAAATRSPSCPWPAARSPWPSGSRTSARGPR